MAPITVDEVLSHRLLLGVVAFVIYNIGIAIYNLYFHPLAKYPGPLLARISPWVNFYHATTGKRPFWIWQCHQVYGETFRYHPNGVFMNSPVAFHDINNSKANTLRTMWYHAFRIHPKIAHTLSTTDKMIHARKRRFLNSTFSDKAVRSAEIIILQHVDRWNELLLDDEKEWGTPRDFTQCADYLVFDILGDLAFGRSLETKEPQDNPLKAIPHGIAELMKFTNPIAQSPFLGAWMWMRRMGLDFLLNRLRPQSMVDYRKFVIESVTKRIKLEAEKKESGQQSERKDMLHYLMQAKDPETGGPAYSSEEILTEAGLLVVAGSDTTSTILAGLFFSLSRNQLIYDKLVREIRSTFQSVDDIRSGTTLYSCQYLRACIDEALRFSPAGGSEMPREAGPGGATVNGEFFPEGTRLSIAVWALYRNEEVYGDPHVYRPERWIVDEKAGVTQEDVERVKNAFFPFSQGPLNCAGKNLAILELLVTVARTLYRMDVRAMPGNTLGECRPELGWGQRDRKTYEFTGDYLAVDRKGPVLQFKKRQE